MDYTEHFYASSAFNTFDGVLIGSWCWIRDNGDFCVGRLKDCGYPRILLRSVYEAFRYSNPLLKTIIHIEEPKLKAQIERMQNDHESFFKVGLDNYDLFHSLYYDFKNQFHRFEIQVEIPGTNEEINLSTRYARRACERKGES